MSIDWKRPDRKEDGSARTLNELLQEVIAAGIEDNKADALKYVRRKVPEEGWYQTRVMDAIRKWAAEKDYTCLCWKSAQGPYSRGGVSDVLALIGGVFLAVEVKRPFWGEVSDLQKQFIADVIRCGGVAGSAVYVEDLQALLEKVDAMACVTEYANDSGLEVSYDWGDPNVP